MSTGTTDMARDVLDLSGKAFSADSTNFPALWDEFNDHLWETLTFQRNVDLPRHRDTVAMSLALQCSDRKATDISKSEMEMWVRQGRGWQMVPPDGHWFSDMLAFQPNEVHTWDEFWRMVIIHLDFAQQAMILKDMDRDGTVNGLIPLPTGLVRPRVTETGRIIYEVAAATELDRAMIGGDRLFLQDYQVIHLKGRMYDGLNGLSNVELGGGLFGLLDAVASFQKKLFANDGRQPIVFESETTFPNSDVGNAAFRRLKDQLTERVRKMANSGDPILLEAGYKAKIIAQNARDAMTNDAFDGLVRRVCGLMNMMPHKVFAYEGVKYDNQATANDAYYNDVLRPVTNLIEKRFRAGLLTKEEQRQFSIEFDTMPLMAGNAKTMVEILDKALKSGAIEIDEFRERVPLGLNPLPKDAGQVRYVPVNMAIIDRDGKVVQQVAEGQNQGAGEGGEAAPVPADGDDA